MAIIKLNEIVYPISQEVGDYIDSLVDQKQGLKNKLGAITKIAKKWLESEYNTIDKSVEKIAINLIRDIAGIA